MFHSMNLKLASRLKRPTSLPEKMSENVTYNRMTITVVVVVVIVIVVVAIILEFNQPN